MKPTDRPGKILATPVEEDRVGESARLLFDVQMVKKEKKSRRLAPPYDLTTSGEARGPDCLLSYVAKCMPLHVKCPLVNRTHSNALFTK